MEREPYFFLSYARRDDRGSAFVRRFYDDLLAELGRLGADCSGQQPFLDIERIGLGMDWESALGNEIGHCRALVALCSPSFAAVGAAYEATGAVRSGRVGHAHCRLFDLADAVAFAGRLANTAGKEQGPDLEECRRPSRSRTA
ncbi:AAC(3) family N-acetyltransferase [Streptomyces sp. MB09-02B]|uniref:AAC(3) family N-acetyltransferase n=1 Tax=Streptomyces sp. MB09-02B TaxID=3028667 RepID=UPI0029BE4C5D|nr:AAC(3) family N-acetyltransferase [Streptomyces sp. MB09-02B]MDX3645523.1 TIR domain-containing protein [Streptomyces sp. MB09-02B]